jgi:hypothetical protein
VTPGNGCRGGHGRAMKVSRRAGGEVAGIATGGPSADVARHIPPPLAPGRGRRHPRGDGGPRRSPGYPPSGVMLRFSMASHGESARRDGGGRALRSRRLRLTPRRQAASAMSRACWIVEAGSQNRVLALWSQARWISVVSVIPRLAVSDPPLKGVGLRLELYPEGWSPRPSAASSRGLTVDPSVATPSSPLRDSQEDSATTVVSHVALLASEGVPCESRVRDYGQPFTEGLPLQQAIHLGQGWFQP